MKIDVGAGFTDSGRDIVPPRDVTLPLPPRLVMLPSAALPTLNPEPARGVLSGLVLPALGVAPDLVVDGPSIDA